MSAESLAWLVQQGQTTARELVLAAINRATRLDGQLNALVVLRAEEALRQADAIDRRRREGRPLGRLAGIPVTVKECFHWRGTPHTLGRAGASPLADDTSPLIRRLVEADAVPIGKGNLSQLMLLHETDSPRYGRANHPWNLERSPGGSGGGDAAAVAAGLAMLGLGTDIGGSIRHPAHCCGIVGFKPTSHALPSQGIETGALGVSSNEATCAGAREASPWHPGLAGLVVQPGTMARCVADARAMFEVLRGEGPPATLPDRPLRIGYWSSDDYFPSCPTVGRAVDETAASLAGVGQRVLRIAAPDIREVVRLYCALMSVDGGTLVRQALAGDRADPRIRRFLAVGRLPQWARRLLGAACNSAGDHYLADLLRGTGRCSRRRADELVQEAGEFADEFWKRLATLRLDAILMPAHPAVALRHGLSAALLPAAGSLFLANLLGAPAGVVPVTQVRASEQRIRMGQGECHRAARANAVGSVGMPCAVQILARPGEDLLALRVMELVERLRVPSSSVPGPRQDSQTH